MKKQLKRENFIDSASLTGVFLFSSFFTMVIFWATKKSMSESNGQKVAFGIRG